MQLSSNSNSPPKRGRPRIEREMTKRLIVEIPASLHKDLKLCAARKGGSVRDIVVEHLRERVTQLLQDEPPNDGI
ncbi:MAG: hypothetical protein F4084_00535 [Rhodothermaceae bacterium]|nr:hypothetical protein [Rhodothermaceae bacterium]